MGAHSLFHTSWIRMWADLGGSDTGHTVRDALVAWYSEPWRKYHSLQHLEECLIAFDAVAELAIRPAEVEAALWFHDAVYDLQRADNEEQSAQLAQRVLTDAGAPFDVVSRVVNLVLVTRNKAIPQAPDEQLLVDVDLAILGASEAHFAQYESQIRAEYSFVPEALFCEKRSAILRAFLARPCIYNTTHFRGLLEQRARSNLAGALSMTSSPQR